MPGLADEVFVGPSLASYRYDGHIWALPVDAAAQVAVSRPDLMQRLGAEVPRTWEDVIRLGKHAAAQRDADRHRAEGRARSDDVLHALRQSRRAMRRRAGAAAGRSRSRRRTHSMRFEELLSLVPAGGAGLGQHRASRGDGRARRPCLLPGRLSLRHLCGGGFSPSAAVPRSSRAAGTGSIRVDSRRHRARHFGKVPECRCRLCLRGLSSAAGDAGGIRTTPRAAGAEGRMDGAGHRCAFRRRVLGDAVRRWRPAGSDRAIPAISGFSARRESWSKATLEARSPGGICWIGCSNRTSCGAGKRLEHPVRRQWSAR